MSDLYDIENDWKKIMKLSTNDLYELSNIILSKAKWGGVITREHQCRNIDILTYIINEWKRMKDGK